MHAIKQQAYAGSGATSAVGTSGLNKTGGFGDSFYLNQHAGSFANTNVGGAPLTSNGGNANSLLEPSGASGKSASESYGAAFNNDALGTDVHRGLNSTTSDGLASAFGKIDLAGVANGLTRPSTAPLPPHSSRNGLNSLQAHQSSRLSDQTTNSAGVAAVASGMGSGMSGDLSGLQAQQALLQQQAAQQAQLNQFATQQMQYNTNAGGTQNLQQQGLGGAGNLPGFDTSAVNQAAANGGTVAEVYQAAYAAAMYAQQQQLQHLVRMQGGTGMVNPQNIAFPGGNVNAAAAAAAAASGLSGIGGGYGDMTNNANAAAAGMLASQINGNPHLGFTNIVNGMNPLMQQQQNLGGNLGRNGQRNDGGGGNRRGSRGGRNNNGRNGSNSAWGNDGGGSSRGNPLSNSAELSTLNSAVPGANGSPTAEELAEMDSRFGSIEECVGQISILARDQYGCRFLQRKFDEDGSAAIDACFDEIIEEAVDLMMDPFGNYLMQKLLECCSDKQRADVVRAVSVVNKNANTGLPELVSIALNAHGTRAVQKLIETLSSDEEIGLTTKALRPGVVTLIKDLNGNHVVQRCLQRLSAEDNQFIYDAAKKHSVEIATHRHGCCVLQRCIDHATEEQKRPLVQEIADQALTLSRDPFGNYVVQYILDLGLSWANAEVMLRLVGNYAELSMQKFSSNVVEKCLKLADQQLEEHRNVVVREIMSSPLLDRLLMDPYGNYVVQSTLMVTKGPLHADLVERIRPHLPLIKNSPFGKRILRLLLEKAHK